MAKKESSKENKEKNRKEKEKGKAEKKENGADNESQDWFEDHEPYKEEELSEDELEELETSLEDEAEFKRAVFSACEVRYSGIKSKVRTAIIRSVIFILLTKAFFAFGVEGTYEKAVYGGIIWGSLLMNLFLLYLQCNILFH